MKTKMKTFVPFLLVLAGAAADPLGGQYQISDATDAAFGQYPSLVSLQRTPTGCVDAETTFLHICAGFIISPNYILTAAHCVNKQGTRNEVTQIVAGMVNLTTGSDETYRQTVGFGNITIHPNYTTEYETFGVMSANDIAIVKLSTPLKFNEGIQPVALPKEDAELHDGTELQFAGWGNHRCAPRASKFRLMLQTLNYTVMNFRTCYLACYELFYESDQLVTIKENLSICTGPLTNNTYNSEAGDSGGPLIKDGVAYGLLSWAFVYWSQMVWQGKLGPTGIFVQLSTYVPWIKENVDDLEFLMSIN